MLTQTILKPAFKLLAMLSIGFVVGCSGDMTGAIRGSGKPVAFEYEQGMDSDTLKTTIDGESFVGKSVMRGASSNVGTVFGGTGFGTASIIGMSTTGDFVAVMLGSKGSSLNCQLQYADSSGFTTSGGVGVCNHSDGRVIDIVW